jgi:hypothetical protein
MHGRMPRPWRNVNRVILDAPSVHLAVGSLPNALVPLRVRSGIRTSESVCVWEYWDAALEQRSLEKGSANPALVLFALVLGGFGQQPALPQQDSRPRAS